jgi:hypothetical protein
MSVKFCRKGVDPSLSLSLSLSLSVSLYDVLAHDVHEVLRRGVDSVIK